MNDLIKALMIIEKYNHDFRTFCAHDILCICGVEPEEVSEEDIDLLEEFGFFVGEDCGETALQSFRWGSC